MDKPRLSWTSNGPMRPTIADLDNPNLGWVENDPYAADCACDDPECDPESCPRFGCDCAGCGAWVASGKGAYLLDGGETYGDCCIEWVDAPTTGA